MPLNIPTQKEIVKKLLTLLTSAVCILTWFSSCSDNESYSDLLKEEEKATNWYMAQRTIALEIPEDSVFITGENAPYYKWTKTAIFICKW